VWDDPRVPFVQFATMSKVSDTWTRAQLVDTLALRAEFGFGFIGVDQAARGYFGKSANELTLPQAALLASVLGDRRVGPGEFDPWCDPTSAADRRRGILDRMRDNLVINDAAYESANRSGLGLGDRPPGYEACSQ
jgi:membrane peptidoglycan carboxypeptidase